MRAVVFGSLAAGLAMFFAVTPVLAHHAIAAKFDTNKSVTLKGLVTQIDWANPHVHVFMKAQDASRSVWAIELESPIDLKNSGWSLTTLKPGDEITVEGISARNGSKQAWAKSMVLTSTRKSVLVGSNGTPPARTPQPLGQCRVGRMESRGWVRFKVKPDTGRNQVQR